ncbi:MAG: hypothetical protein U5O39_19820 [Gammaproteobacteria bacterium]|nr:hypothetical protein [Gammaproteobacteria bacterium]
MSDKRNSGSSSGKDDSAIPAITPAQDEVASYRRSGRSDGPKQSNFNGLLVFVIVLLCIMMGIGGYALWEVQQRLQESTQILTQARRNVEDLERRLSASGDQTSKAFQDLEEQVSTNFSEIDKLWGVSYRNNRPNIEKNTESIETIQQQLDRDLKQISQRMTQVDQSVEEFTKTMAELRSNLRADNEEMMTQVSLVRGQMQDHADALENNKRSIDALERKMESAQEAIDVIDKYRQRLNQQLLDLRAQVQSSSSPSSSSAGS